MLSTTGLSLLATATLSKIRFPLPPNNPLTRTFNSKDQNFMAGKAPTEGAPPKSSVHFSPHVNRLQDVIGNDPAGGWDKCWEDGLTPWDLGRPTPIVEHLQKMGMLPNGRALVPGCGSGHDVVALASPERYVIGLDVSDAAIRKAQELSPASSNTSYFSFLKEDFFTWRPDELFDLIFDYTFFCAIEPSMRPAWGIRMKELLKPDGELVTLMFPIEELIGGPPFGVSVADYEKVLCPLGFQAIYVADNELVVGPRKGKEKLGRWKMEKLPSQL